MASLEEATQPFFAVVNSVISTVLGIADEIKPNATMAINFFVA